MAEKSAPHTSNVIAELAGRQFGVISAAQLYALGYSKDWVGAKVAAGWLLRLHRGVYAVGHRNLTRKGRWMAAVLACGDGAVLSHYAAAALWSIRPEKPSSLIDVTLRTRAGRRRRRGLRIHRPRRLPTDEVCEDCEIPVTAPARTILDLASVIGIRSLERTIDEADRLRLVGADDLFELLRRHLGHRGAGRLRGVLSRHRIGTTITRSELEERFLRLCRQRHLPQPEVNVPLLDYVVDFLWREPKLVVEVDGRASHGTSRAFQADRDRDGRLSVAGYRVLRFTWWDVTRRPAVVADRIRRLLQAGPPSRGAFLAA
jgi:very-short-patch-repair endonuclease/predicted transcriptional regulator of viral defense system